MEKKNRRGSQLRRKTIDLNLSSGKQLNYQLHKPFIKDFELLICLKSTFLLLIVELKRIEIFFSVPLIY